MQHTKLRQALKFASHKHAGQVRKGTDIPYIVHPFEVGMFLQGIGMGHSAIIAGFLHDTIEDTDTTYDEIADIFGSNVADIVLEVTEPNKKKALKKAATYSMDAVKVKVADLMCNISDIHDVYEKIGDAIFDRFSTGKKVLKHYREMGELLLQRSQNNMVLKREIPKILTMIDSMS